MKIPGGTGAYGAQKPMENIDFIVPGGGGLNPISPWMGKKGMEKFSLYNKKYIYISPIYFDLLSI